MLPDTAAGQAIAGVLTQRASARTVPHASGRPWLVGDWTDQDVVWAEAGQRRVAVLGRTALSPEALAGAAGRLGGPRDLDGLARSLPGSCHLAASVDGRVRVQGTVSTACQVFYAMVGGITVAADRPGPLARLTGAGVVEELLAARLIAPWPPWPLSERCLWRGVEALPAGCYLELERDGRARPVRWWSPPTPQVPLAEGAELLRSALREAVLARTHGVRTLSADLSGGMDSTSLCFLAAESVDRLVTTRWQATDPADEDQEWADRAAADLPSTTRHLLLTRNQTPRWFADLTTAQQDEEAPFAWIRTRRRLEHQARQVADLGATRHLTGHGGDELFLASPLALHTLARAHPLRCLPMLRAHRAQYRWRLRPTLRALLGNPSFGQWLTSRAASLHAPLPEFAGDPDFGWGIGYRMPPWASRDAVHAAADTLRALADHTPHGLSELRAQHAALADVRLCGDTIRRVNRLVSANGVCWEAPYVDDRVVEIALSIRPQDTVTLDQYKPALVAAMRGIVPDALLARATKSEYSAEAYASLRQHRVELLDLCDDMALARLGLVDAEALRRTLRCLPPSSLTLMPLVSTFACEVWLRSLPAATQVPLPSTVAAGDSR